jgi:hypothetical protein
MSGADGRGTSTRIRWARQAGAAEVVLFADLDNPSSNRIYQQIGFEPVDDTVRVRFGE